MVYFYTLLPGKTLDDSGNPDSKWNGMGIGNVTGLNSVENYTNGVNVMNQSGVNIQQPSSYPNIIVDGISYVYAAPGSGNENSQGYYTIQWIRLVRSAGANTGNN